MQHRSLDSLNPYSWLNYYKAKNKLLPLFISYMATYTGKYEPLEQKRMPVLFANTVLVLQNTIVSYDRISTLVGFFQPQKLL